MLLFFIQPGLHSITVRILLISFICRDENSSQHGDVGAASTTYDTVFETIFSDTSSLIVKHNLEPLRLPRLRKPPARLSGEACTPC